MTTSSSTCSRTVTVVVASDLHWDFFLADKEMYRNFIPGDRVNLSNKTRGLIASSPRLLTFLREDLYTFSLNQISITNRQVYLTMDKIEKIILSSAEGMEWTMSRLFTPVEYSAKRPRGPQPGTLRIYSNELVCFFNGRNWRKIKICG